MRPAITAFLLSAFVFPGLGQLYKQDRAKGVLLVLLANLLLGILFIAFLVLFSREYMAVYYPEPITREILKPLLLGVAKQPLFLVPFLALVGLWAFAAADAALKAVTPPPEEG